MNINERKIKNYLETGTGLNLTLLRNGWPDFLAVFEWHRTDGRVSWHHFGLEVKHGRNRVSTAQAKIHSHLEHQGVPVYVTRSNAETRKILKHFLNKIGFNGLDASVKPFRRKSFKQLAPPIFPHEEDWIG